MTLYRAGLAAPYTLDLTWQLTSASETDPIRELANVVTIAGYEWRSVATAGVTAHSPMVRSPVMMSRRHRKSALVVVGVGAPAVGPSQDRCSLRWGMFGFLVTAVVAQPQPTASWLVPALGALLGVALGGAINAWSQHRHWLRDSRLDAYAKLVSAYDATTTAAQDYVAAALAVADARRSGREAGNAEALLVPRWEEYRKP